MKLALASADRILLELTACDLQKYGLLPEGEIGCRESVRQRLERLLQDLAAGTGQHYRLQQSVRIDCLPDRFGGCLLVVSGLQKQSGESFGSCFAAKTENDLIDAARAVCAEYGGDITVTLLQAPQGYFLLTPPLSVRLKALLSEYMLELPLHHGGAEVLQEHCRVLVSSRPFSALCGGA